MEGEFEIREGKNKEKLWFHRFGNKDRAGHSHSVERSGDVWQFGAFGRERRC